MIATARRDYPPPPAIAGVSAGVDRPLWSVMIPSYRATSLLEEALRSVLSQDLGPDQMQIAVVDDCSDHAAERIVAEVAPGRVEFLRNATTLGLASNWNSCLSRARGHWVHILHQDDLVLPGFYERLGRGIAARPDLGAVLCRHASIDERGEQIKLYPAERDTPGVLDGWAEKLAIEQRVQCPAIAVKREVYERIGGFRDDLCFVLDWEMWARIAFFRPVWYEPEILACWRDHPRSETHRLRKAGLIIPDIEKGIEIISGFAPEPLRPKLAREASRRSRWWTSLEVDRLMTAGDPWQALGLVYRSQRHEGPANRALAMIGFAPWAAKTWMKRLLPGTRRGPASAGDSPPSRSA